MPASTGLPRDQIVLIQTPSVEENAPLKAKNGVRLNHTLRTGKVAEERPLVLVYQETILTFKGIAWKNDD